MSNRPWVKPMICESIQCPVMTITSATPASFGTNVSVCSWICVADWIRPMNRPIASDTPRIGAASLVASRIDCTAMSMTDPSFTMGTPSRGRTRFDGCSGARSMVEARDQRADDERPAVDHDEQQQLERQRDQY